MNVSRSPTSLFNSSYLNLMLLWPAYKMAGEEVGVPRRKCCGRYLALSSLHGMWPDRPTPHPSNSWVTCGRMELANGPAEALTIFQRDCYDGHEQLRQMCLLLEMVLFRFKLLCLPFFLHHFFIYLLFIIYYLFLFICLLLLHCCNF